MANEAGPFVYPVFSWPYKKIEEALARYEAGDVVNDIKSD